mgnify:CR=1 FL=1
MALKYSTAVKNARLDAIETAIGASAVLKIRTGAAPANVSDADTGAVLVTMNLPADYMAAASAGSKAKSGTWQDAAADASGYAAHWRLYASDGTTPHAQGDCFMPATAWAASTAYTVGQFVKNNARVYVCTVAGTSAGAGGPTTTGTGITDNTVTWNYVCPDTGELQLDSAVIAAGQQVTVSAFALTAGN